ncbi:MAG: hypothetical protein AB1758_07335 [Candidatus Eremiobacterota bacterium]
MKRLLGILAVLASLFVPAVATPDYNEDQVVAAIKVLMYREPCCGSCPRIDTGQARSILAYLRGEETAEGAALWRSVGDKVLIELDRIDPREGQRLRKHLKNSGRNHS